MKKRPVLQIDKADQTQTLAQMTVSNPSGAGAMRIPGSGRSAYPAVAYAPRGMKLSTSAPVSAGMQYPRIAPNPTGVGTMKYQFGVQQNTMTQNNSAAMNVETTDGIDPAMLSSDVYLSETLFPLQIDVEMQDVMQINSAQQPSSVGNGTTDQFDMRSPFDSNFTDEYLADEAVNSVLSASFPEDSANFGPFEGNGTNNSSPIMFRPMVGSAPVSAGIPKPGSGGMKKNRSQSSTSGISVSPQEFGEGSGSLSKSRALGSSGNKLNSNMSEQGDDEEHLSKHVTALEKQRKRRESHNAVERRRRDNINERITELGELVPDCQHDSTKPHKGLILKKTTDYIKHMQRMNNELVQRVQELEKQLEAYDAKDDR